MRTELTLLDLAAMGSDGLVVMTWRGADPEWYCSACATILFNIYVSGGYGMVYSMYAPASHPLRADCCVCNKKLHVDERGVTSCVTN